MTIFRNEIRTGLLVVLTLGALVALLLYLGAPGVFVAQKTFRIYFDNAAGLEPGAPVLLGGRKIGQVTMLHSPVAEKDRPDPKLETLVEVHVDKAAKIFSKVKAQMTLPSMLGKPVIDFTTGEEASGLAADGAEFIGVRQPGLADAVPAVLEKIDPMLIKATATFDALQKTADNLTVLTKDGSDLPAAFAEFKKFGTHLNELSGPEGSLSRSLLNVEKMTGDDGKLAKAFDHIEEMTGDDGKLAKAFEHIADITGPGSDLSKTLANTEKFTADLAGNKDIKTALGNFRRASENMDRQLTQLGGKLSRIADNLESASDTVKHQPWRLVWPSTKKYSDEAAISPPKASATPTLRTKEKVKRK